MKSFWPALNLPCWHLVSILDNLWKLTDAHFRNEDRNCILSRGSKIRHLCAKWKSVDALPLERVEKGEGTRPQGPHKRKFS